MKKVNAFYLDKEDFETMARVGIFKKRLVTLSKFHFKMICPVCGCQKDAYTVAQAPEEIQSGQMICPDCGVLFYAITEDDWRAKVS